MPSLPKRPCTKPGCTDFMPCAAHERKRRRFWDEHRDQAIRSLYTGAWATYSKARLAEYPICTDPYGEHKGRLVVAGVTDHVVPHRGDRGKFWNPLNHQSLCVPCHNRKSLEERERFGAGGSENDHEHTDMEAVCF